jgi:hypothetical protein
MRSFDEYPDIAGDSILEPAPVVAGGTILGIHNLAIVFPQFIVSCCHLGVRELVNDFSTDRTGIECNIPCC